MYSFKRGLGWVPDTNQVIAEFSTMHNGVTYRTTVFRRHANRGDRVIARLDKHFLDWDEDDAHRAFRKTSWYESWGIDGKIIPAGWGPCVDYVSPERAVIVTAEV